MPTATVTRLTAQDPSGPTVTGWCGRSTRTSSSTTSRVGSWLVICCRSQRWIKKSLPASTAATSRSTVLDQAVQLGLISKKDENIPIEKEDSLENSVKKLKNLSQSFEFVTNSYTRTQEDIIKRLINKSNGSDKISSFKGALNLIAETINIRGNIGEAVKDLKDLWKDHKLPSKKILMLEELVSLISAMGVPKKQITVDLGLVRDVGYYSGMVFDIKAGSGNEIIGGGGRYDGLSKDLGFKDIPARGFAFDFN